MDIQVSQKQCRDTCSLGRAPTRAFLDPTQSQQPHVVSVMAPLRRRSVVRCAREQLDMESCRATCGRHTGPGARCLAIEAQPGLQRPSTSVSEHSRYRLAATARWQACRAIAKFCLAHAREAQPLRRPTRSASGISAELRLHPQTPSILQQASQLLGVCLFHSQVLDEVPKRCHPTHVHSQLGRQRS